ncbi:MAG: adenine deaminase [Epsilonproteobacteria bacterium]|nr:adenine deaminase [Campylobacterota bacterium]
MTQCLHANLVDIPARSIYPARIEIAEGRIYRITPVEMPAATFVLPGFIDAHIHIESSLLTPAAFGRVALCHGTVATVSDPHEIANVLGERGIDFMLDSAAKTPMHICFGAPSCVPATPFETSGAVLNAESVSKLLKNPRIGYLSEVMNYPAVIDREPETMRKIRAAHRLKKPVDGHAPGLRGEKLQRYIEAGITTDHECTDIREAREKIAMGMKILIREGSAAKSFQTLIPLLTESPEHIMFCSDDRHPDDLVEGHIDRLVRRAVAEGYDLFNVLRAACLTPAEHYNLPVGRLRPGDRADFVEVTDLRTFRHLATYIRGRVVAREGAPLQPLSTESRPNRLPSRTVPAAYPIHPKTGCSRLRVIGAHDRKLQTDSLTLTRSSPLPDPKTDILKIVVLNRYDPHAPPVVGLVRGFGLKRGAIAGSVAHDSHNLIAVGCDDTSLANALQAVINAGGGLVAVIGEERFLLPLPIAGLMQSGDGFHIAESYRKLKAFAKERLGTPLSDPFMTLSFMALPVIPELKMTDRGLFDVTRFQPTDLCIKEPPCR